MRTPLLNALKWWAKLTNSEREAVADYCGFKRNSVGLWRCIDVRRAYQTDKGKEALGLLHEALEA